MDEYNAPRAAIERSHAKPKQPKVSYSMAPDLREAATQGVKEFADVFGLLLAGAAAFGLVCTIAGAF